MQTFKQIVFRMSDTALMIINTDETIETNIRFVKDLTDIQKLAFHNLGEYCASLITPPEFDYIVFTVDIERLDVQCIEGDVTCVNKSEMNTNDKKTLNDVLVICTELLNE